MFLSTTQVIQSYMHLHIFNLTYSHVMIVSLKGNNKLVSMNLKNMILDYYKEIELSSITNTIVDLVIKSDDKWIGDLKITNLMHLQSIVIERESLQSVRLFTIMKNPSLKSILVCKRSCSYVSRFELSSLIAMIRSLDLPQLETIYTGRDTFFETSSLILIGWVVCFSLLDLPQLHSFSVVSGSFNRTISITISSAHLLASSSDVPFTNGKCIKYLENENSAFQAITSSDITFDSGMYFCSSFNVVSQAFVDALLKE